MQMQASMARTLPAPPFLSHNHQTKISRLTRLSPKQKSVNRCRAMAADPYVDYKSSPKSVFPAEACDTVGGESCQGKIGVEVKLDPESRSKESPKTEDVDREYIDYNSSPKTVFPDEACDDLGGEFCEAEYQTGAFQEKEASK